jgi:osmotically-inducible protein OsmY
MNFSSKKRILVMCAYIGSVVSGLAGFGAPAGAQTLAASAVNPPRSQSMAGSAALGVNSMTDEQLRERVQAALHSDRYLFDRHISVSVDNGAVALHGIVFSASDLEDAVRIADQAALGKRVVDDLWIDAIEGGRH